MITALALLVFQTPQVITLEGFRAPSEAVVATRAMKYIPFEVPTGVTSIEVVPEFDHGPDKNLKNTVDLGLFDPRGTAQSGAGLRGWQGGAGKGFRLTGSPETTSTWYLPGEIPAGTWHIAQYFLKSTPAGLKYKYTVTLRFDGPKPPKGIAPFPTEDRRVISTDKRYYSGNLHMHSTHSDGGQSLTETVQRCKDVGFDFVASTEHNTPAAI